MDNRNGKSRTCQQCVYNCSSCTFVKSKMIKKRFFKRKIKYIESLEKININAEHIHITPYQNAAIIVLRVKIHNKELSKHSIHLVTKRPKYGLCKCPLSYPLAINQFIKEMLFYSCIRKNFKWNVFAKCCVFNVSTSQPIIMLEDLTACGYKQIEHKLSYIQLKRYLITLAYFHANSLWMKTEYKHLYQNFIKIISDQDNYEDMIRQQQAARDFINGSIMNALNRDLKEKIERKLETVKHLKKKRISILVHGSCTRSNAFFKEMKKTYFVRFVNFQTLQLHSPVVDFGRILLTNLPNGNDIAILKSFCKSMLRFYLNALTCAHPLATLGYPLRATWKREIVNNLLFSYVNLNVEEREAIENHNSILHALNNLGCFE